MQRMSQGIATDVEFVLCYIFGGCVYKWLHNGERTVALNMQQVAMVADSAFVAMTDDAIAVSIGNGAADRSAAALAADPPSPPMTMGMDIDASKYYELMAMSVMEPVAGEDPISLEARESMRDALLEWSRLLDRTGFNVRFTESGIVIDSNTTLAE